MDYHFIKVSDTETANKLGKLGFQEIPSSQNGVRVFLNCHEMQFSSDVDQSKLHYSNKLCI